MRIGKPALIAALVLFASGFLAVAQAYVLPSSFVLEKWVKRTRRVKTVYIRQRTTIYDSKLFGGSVAVEEEIWIRRPSQYRRTAVYPNGTYDVIAGKDRVVRSWEGKVELLPLVDALGPLGALFVYRDVDRLNGFLRQMSVDVEQTRWVLLDKGVGLEVGEPKGARLTFSKEELLPIRADLGRKSYQFEMSGASGFPIRYPKTIETYVDGELTEKTEVLAVKTGVRIDGNRFLIPKTGSTSRRK